MKRHKIYNISWGLMNPSFRNTTVWWSFGNWEERYISFPRRSEKVEWQALEPSGLMLVLTCSSWVILNKPLLLFRLQLPHLITAESGVVTFKVLSNCNSIFLLEMLDINTWLLTHSIWCHHFKLGKVICFYIHLNHTLLDSHNSKLLLPHYQIVNI